MEPYKETFISDDMSVTLLVEGADGKPPKEGEPYKVRYLVNGKDDSETELVENYSVRNIFSELESLAEDYFDAEVTKLEREYKSRL
jgi:hypothetical protein